MVGLHPLLDYLVSINGKNRGIALPLEINRWNDAGRAAHGVQGDLPLCGGIWPSLAQRQRAAGLVGSGLVLQSRMDTDGGEDVGIGGAHNHRHARARRHSGDIDSIGVDVPLGRVLFNRLNNPGNDRRLTTAAGLVGGQEPVPALGGVRATGLLWVYDDKLLLVGQRIHLGTIGKIRGILCAAMQHHDQRDNGSLVAYRGVDKVGTTTG